MHNIFVDFFKSIRIFNVLAIACAQGILCQAFNVDIALAIGFTFSLTAAGFLQNNLLDFELDTIGKNRVNIFLNQYFNLSHYIVQVVFLGTILSTIYFFISGNSIHGYMLLISGTLLYLYNCYLKKIAFIGNLAVAILSSNAILYIFWLEGQLNSANYLFLGFIFVLSLLREIIKDLEDKDVDKQFGYKTLPILLPLNQIKIVTVLLSFATFYLLIGLDIPVWGKGLVASLLLLQSVFTFKNSYSQASFVLKVVFFVGILMLGVKGDL
jgi:4-hydroxybenzoate polyprenyltransferase